MRQKISNPYKFANHQLVNASCYSKTKQTWLTFKSFLLAEIFLTVEVLDLRFAIFFAAA